MNAEVTLDDLADAQLLMQQFLVDHPDTLKNQSTQQVIQNLIVIQYHSLTRLLQATDQTAAAAFIGTLTAEQAKKLAFTVIKEPEVQVKKSERDQVIQTLMDALQKDFLATKAQIENVHKVITFLVDQLINGNSRITSEAEISRQTGSNSYYVVLTMMSLWSMFRDEVIQIDGKRITLKGNQLVFVEEDLA